MSMRSLSVFNGVSSGWSVRDGYRHRDRPEGCDSWILREGWGLLLGHAWGPRVGHTWGFSHGHGQSRHILLVASFCSAKQSKGAGIIIDRGSRCLFVGRFLDYLDAERHVSVATAMLGSPACTRSFALPLCATPSTPQWSSECSLPPPSGHPSLSYVDEAEAQALVASPDTSSRTGGGTRRCGIGAAGRLAGLGACWPQSSRRELWQGTSRALHWERQEGALHAAYCPDIRSLASVGARTRRRAAGPFFPGQAASSLPVMPSRNLCRSTWPVLGSTARRSCPRK